MRRTTLMIAFSFLFLSSVSFAQQEPAVLEVSPTSGPAAGGTRVTLRMSSVPTCPILPPPPALWFGDTMVTLAERNANTLVFIAPPHAPGLVDLRLSACGLDEDITIPNGFAFFRQAAGGGFNVESITPAWGPASGGTEVTVALDEVPFCVDPVPGEKVLFNGVEGTNVVQNNQARTIKAISPPHVIGPVTLTVQACGGASATVEHGFTYVQGDSNPNPGFEPVLFPVVFQGPGALGSLWNTRISVYNAGDATVTSANAIFEGDPSCPAVCGCEPSSLIAPGRTATVCVEQFQNPAGLLFFPPASATHDLHYQTRVFDSSRATANAGTELPVVRGEDFRSDEILLLDVPVLDPNFRVHLRVYAPEGADGTRVRLEVLDPHSTFPTTSEMVITLSRPSFASSATPAFAFIRGLELDIDRMVPPGVPRPFRVHLKLTPLTEGERIWGFVSITNNETQLITTVTPQS